MTETKSDPLAVTLFSEIIASEQMMRGRLSRALPRGMELSHFMVLNYLAGQSGERTPAQIARIFHLTKGAITNTLSKLEAKGYIHIRPDWDDARRKKVSISQAGQQSRDQAVQAVAPVFEDVMQRVGSENVRAALPFMRDLRVALEQGG